MARVWTTLEKSMMPLTGRPNRMPMLAFQAKCSPQPSHRPWVRSHAIESRTPANMVMRMLIQVASGLKACSSPKSSDMTNGRSGRADSLDQAAKGIAAKGDLFGQRADGERRKVEKTQPEGARRRPEADVQSSGRAPWAARRARPDPSRWPRLCPTRVPRSDASAARVPRGRRQLR